MTVGSLYRGFGLKYQKLITSLFENGSIVAKVKTKSDKFFCSSCKSRNTIKVQRMWANKTGTYFACNKKSYTHSFWRFVLDLLTFGTTN